MRILLTNDDGIFAPGLTAMHRALLELGTVDVVAPATVQSGMGHGITIHEPITAEKVALDKSVGYSVRGKPADCVKIAMTDLLESPPDLVVSGINDGANASVNVIYSGTVAGACEGAMLGFPAIAVSMKQGPARDFKSAAEIALRLIRSLLELGLSRKQLINVNIPDLTQGPPKGVRVVPQATRMMSDSFNHHAAPNGLDYYWLEGMDYDRAANPQDNDLDVMHQGYVAVTPITFDRTDYAQLKLLQEKQTLLSLDDTSAPLR